MKTNVNLLSERMIEYIGPAGTNETLVDGTLEAPISAGLRVEYQVV